MHSNNTIPHYSNTDNIMQEGEKRRGRDAPRTTCSNVPYHNISEMVMMVVHVVSTIRFGFGIRLVWYQ